MIKKTLISGSWTLILMSTLASSQFAWAHDSTSDVVAAIRTRILASGVSPDSADVVVTGKTDDGLACSITLGGLKPLDSLINVLDLHLKVAAPADKNIDPSDDFSGNVSIILSADPEKGESASIETNSAGLLDVSAKIDHTNLAWIGSWGYFKTTTEHDELKIVTNDNSKIVSILISNDDASYRCNL
jgi:hypothetical protein